MSDSLRTRIERFAAIAPADLDRDAAEDAFRELLAALEAGTVRAAEPADDDAWQVNTWVKQGILLGFRLGRLIGYDAGALSFIDKHTYPPRRLSVEQGVRVVPGGSAIRSGAYLASGVVCMPPMYANVGAYIDEGSMIDSHALVGSCAQIGKRVHLSAAAQIGGVLEPVGARPVIIEDDVFVGGNCGLYEGCRVRRGAVLAAGVVLTAGTRLYDTVHDRVLTSETGRPLEVPEYAVVVPGARSLDTDFGRAHGLSLYTPVIVKYRDARTDAATTLESALR